MRKPLLLTLFCLIVAMTALAQTPSVIPLYAGVAPNSRPSQVQEKVDNENGKIRISKVVQPTLTVYRAPKEKVNGTAVIICPGGGYGLLAMDHEGYDVAKRLTEMGITAFVLKYRLPSNESQTDKALAPLLDAQQAIRVVRQRATEFGIKPAHIGLMGFSAGGHLAATAGTLFTKPVGDPKDQTSVRPDFLVLLYPVISFADSLTHAGSRTALLGAAPTAAQILHYSAERQVSAKTPPTFLMHAADDAVVPVQNSLVFYQACLQHKVFVEMHLYPKGGHGFGMNNPTTKDNWTDRLHNWLDAGGWLR
ncbi:alpha/beta hydrolase [Hymenobacter seoulensis]